MEERDMCLHFFPYYLEMPHSSDSIILNIFKEKVRNSILCIANYCYLFHASLQHSPSASDWEQQHQPFGHPIMLWLQVHCGDKTAFPALQKPEQKPKKKKKSMSFLLNPSILRSVYVAVSHWLAYFNICQEKWIQFMEILSYEQLFQLMMHLLSQWKFECWVRFSLTF